MFHRPTWAEISRLRLRANYQKLSALAGMRADLLAVVKADAYGHDVQICAPVLADAGARWLGVTSAEEGAAVRSLCPQARILLMSGIFPGEAEAVLDWDLTPVVWELWQVELLQEAAEARGLPPRSVPLHLEMDTGMSRQGVRGLGEDMASQASSLLARLGADSPLYLQGLMTHFSEPERITAGAANLQIARLERGAEWLRMQGFTPQWLHAGNSSTVVAGPDREALQRIAQRLGARLMLRPGLALYGYLDRITENGVAWEGDPGLAAVLSWKTEVTSLRMLAAGETAGYGNTFRAQRETRLALLPVGYADGYNRLLSNRGSVLLRGRKAPVAGRVSMDQTMIDVTGIPDVGVGDEVVLLGSQGGAAISAWDLADLTGTIAWEVLCAIGARVPRIAVD
jgi:alanine racemase